MMDGGTRRRRLCVPKSNSVEVAKSPVPSFISAAGGRDFGDFKGLLQSSECGEAGPSTRISRALT